MLFTHDVKISQIGLTNGTYLYKQGLNRNVSVQVDCGTNMSALLTCDGEVYTWGKNFDGQLGIGNRMEQVLTTIYTIFFLQLKV